MLIWDLNELVVKSVKDDIVRIVAISILVISIVLCLTYSVILGIGNILFFVIGCVITTVLLKHKDVVFRFVETIKSAFGYVEFLHEDKTGCQVCGNNKCSRHNSMINNDSWRKLLINQDLDKSIEQFYNCILNNFIVVWLSEFSNDQEFLNVVKSSLREATSRLIVNVKKINAPHLLTNKLLPCFFSHYENVNALLKSGVHFDKLSMHFIMERKTDRPIHPAVYNRKAEIDYLRDIAKFLIPRLFKSDIFESKIFFSLIRELLACWVLLPILDAISDPNIINLLIINATNKTSTVHSSNTTSETISHNRKQKVHKDVIFLENFTRSISFDDNQSNSDDLLKNQQNLYCFMQFLKKEGAVDLLRFHLDVEGLNKELQDPKLIGDPKKLSALQQQSEKLLATYQTQMNYEFRTEDVSTLSEAHEIIVKSLNTKWRKAFHTTKGYFELTYGSRTMKDPTELKIFDTINVGPVSRISSKIKGAIRSTVDGPIEATEVATVWDGLTESHTGSANIYSSVTQKLKKERGKNLDNFMVQLMLSIEQKTDFGEDVVEIKFNSKEEVTTHSPPGSSRVFGNLFEMNSTQSSSTSTKRSHGTRGPSQCFIYILVKILRAPKIIVRFALALICVSQSAVDTLISAIITKLINIGLYQPRLADLIHLLREILFIEQRTPEPTPKELLDRQILARDRLNSISEGLGEFADIFQTPSINKNLIYCLFDIILGEMYPELHQHSVK